MGCVPEKQPIYEALEACRPGSQDLRDPGLGFLAKALAEDSALAARYGWIQGVDRQVAAVFADLEVPEGVEARILEKLQAALADQRGLESIGGTELEEEGLAEQRELETGLPVLEDVPPEGGALEQESTERVAILGAGVGEAENAEFGQNGQYIENTLSGEPVKKPLPQATALSNLSKKRYLRRWVLVAGVLGAAAAGFLLIFWPKESPQALSLAQIQAEALRFAMSEPQELFGSGQPWAGQPSQTALSFSRAIWVPGHPRFPAEIRFRKIAGLLGREGFAYDLRSSEGICATLYVLPVHQAGAVPVAASLPVEPPRYEQTTRTGGYCAAAWQENGCLYMLVVHGDSARAYYHFFRPQVIT